MPSLDPAANLSGFRVNVAGDFTPSRKRRVPFAAWRLCVSLLQLDCDSADGSAIDSRQRIEEPLQRRGEHIRVLEERRVAAAENLEARVAKARDAAAAAGELVEPVALGPGEQHRTAHLLGEAAQ